MIASHLTRWALAGLLLTAAVAPSEATDGFVGPYLAGRQATMESDYRAAAEFYLRALVAEPKNTTLLENGIIALIGKGEVKKAAGLAERLGKLGADNPIANLTLFAELAQTEDYAGATAALGAGKSAGPLVDGLFRAWVELGLGEMSAAADTFDTVAETEGLKAFGLYHKALALATAGDFESADEIFSGVAAGPLRATRRGVIAHAEILSQLERDADAVELIEKTFGADPDPLLADMLARLRAGETLPFTVIGGPKDGIAEVFYTVAGALNGESTDVETLIYARLAEYLRPGHVDAILLLAGVYEAQGQYELANEAYNRIPREDPAYRVAELGRAEALISAGRFDAAIEVLEQLAKANPDMVTVWTTLGDTFRRQERYGDAARAYDKGIATFEADAEAQWPVYYARGISHERDKKWELAEADFRKALQLKPGQPQVLNYLGYSYLEMKTNLDEALEMIESAVAARPDDGAIVDSLGWALYRLGRYDEAVTHMERAIALMPIDPVVNDHLGDVYWAVDRKREAEFQWKRALSFHPETEAEAERIRRKLAVGLDRVLADEGAAPLDVSRNEN